MKRIICVCLLVILMMAALAGCGQKEQKKVSDYGFYLDTECTITVYTDDEEKGRKIIKDAFALCEKYEGKMSKTVKGSDIYKLNHANGKAVSVSDSVREVLSMGIEMGKESKGRFDITVGRLTDIWDFKSDEPKVPRKSIIKAAMKTVDYENLVIEGSKVRLKRGDAEKGSEKNSGYNTAHVDLGGIAKGYISGKVAGYITKKGITSGLINFGGNVITIGKKPDGSLWNVGIQDPNEEGASIVGSTEAENQAVITSGIYERKFESGGKTYHHIIDPRTGYPAETDVEGVTLTCPREKAGECDAYSTICLLEGSSEGLEFIESKKDFEALFYCKDGSIKKTDGMDFKEAAEENGV